MTDTLFEGDLEVQKGKHHIFTKVLGKNLHAPCILFIPGGPGFDHESLEDFAVRLQDDLEAQGYYFNVILFDPLNCGQKIEPVDPEREYTFENYAEIAAQVVEGVKAKLKIDNMDLRIWGGSFGSMTAMSVPTLRPDWILDANSHIKLNQLISQVGPVSYRSIEESNAYVDAHYSKDPNYENIKKSLYKISHGELKDQNDYVHHCALELAPLYADKYARLMNCIGNFIKAHADFSIKILKQFDMIEICHSIYVALTRCSLEVLNYFFSHEFNHFDLLTLIKNNETLYQSLPIYCISGDRDHIANPASNASVLKKLLPNNLSMINFNAKHSIYPDSKKIYLSILEQIFTGKLSQQSLMSNQNLGVGSVSSFELASQFKQQAQHIQQLSKRYYKKSWIDTFCSFFSSRNVDEASQLENQFLSTYARI